MPKSDTPEEIIDSASKSACFVVGTMILTDNGLVPIEEIEAGDIVIATDTETGETAEKEVVETYVRETNELIHIWVNGEEIITTLTHPFYVPEKGWTDAIDLRVGDILVLVNGEYVIVEKTQHEILEEPITVYNFQVADFHTYYVGEQSALVHNKCTENGDVDELSSEVYYRTMSQEDFDQLVITGEVPPSMHGETFISPTASYSKAYDGVLVEFHLESGTTQELVDIGVKNKSNLTAHNYPNMPFVESGWMDEHAFFKGEGGQINIGFGSGAAREKFNSRIVDFFQIGDE